MGKIIILDELTSNKIAAGEVVERPASVVKELVENSIDAGSTNISVEIRNGGIRYIKITDNGSGILSDDACIAFERHATSKIRGAHDLESISTLGFRGEALASIASVCEAELTTKTESDPFGTFVSVKGGNILETRQVGCPKGTTFVIRNLFYNTPARFKFLKKDSTEASYISDIITRISLAKPEISFRLISQDSVLIHAPGNSDLKSTIFSLYGKEIAKNVLAISHEENGIKIDGYVGKPEIARSSRNYQSIYVNGRYIKSKLVATAIDEAYKTIILKNKFAFAVLNITISPLNVDVNVHPAKTEVRFMDESLIFKAIYHSIVNVLLYKMDIRDANINSNKAYSFHDNDPSKVEYIQQSIEISKEQSAIKSLVKEVPFSSYKQDLPDKQNLPDANIQDKKPMIRKEQELVKDKKTEPQINKLIEINEPYNVHEDKSNIIIGQVFLTYILIQKDNDLILIDQHAAHERIKYEKLKKLYKNRQNISQILLNPIVFELSNQELKFLENELEFVEQFGFKYQSFGNNSIILREIPFFDKGVNPTQFFIEVLDYMMQSYRYKKEDIIDETLHRIACKSSIKAKDKLSDLEIRKLLNDLDELDMPFTCPHGRPTMIKLTKHELEKMFKR